VRSLAATLLRTSIELRLGRSTSIIAELSTLAKKSPTDESVVVQFMGGFEDEYRSAQRLSQHRGPP
jgi:hypothetical protein